MELNKEIDKAKYLIDETNRLIVGLPILPGDRDRISVSLLHLSLEHCNGIIPLIEQNIFGSALALMRPQFEAYVNGVWIKHCANDKQIESFKNGSTPIFQERINAIEKLEGYDQKTLSAIKEENWKIFCDFTHGGFRQVMTRNTKDGISYNFPSGYIANAVKATVVFSLSASVALAQIVGDKDLDSKLLMLYKKIYETNISTSSD